MAKTYHIEKWGLLCWRDGLPVFIGGREITPHGYVWWYPWNWVLFLVALLVVTPYRKLRNNMD
ncbi:hypothetical protein [Aeromonas caviae]|uniref:hypothetical protein n=1 Tax=Aeromonas caviae TaxID=648 RepID=UPI00313A88AE